MKFPIVVSGPAWRAAARRKSRGPSAFSRCPAIGHHFKAYGAPWRGRFGQLRRTIRLVSRVPRLFANVSSPSLGRISRAIRDSRRVLVSFRGSFVEADGAAIRASGPHDSLRFEISIFESCRFYDQLFFPLSLSLFLSPSRRSSFGEVVHRMEYRIIFVRKNYFWNVVTVVEKKWL